MDADVLVRRFRPGDRESVRRICFATGYMGEPADWYWRDFESFAEIWSGYYTDREPESAFVVEREGRVAGYLLGCIETARAPSPARSIVRQMLRRGLLLRPGTAAFFWRSIADTVRGPVPGSGDLRDPRWPSHLHIDLLPEVRGRGAGAALIASFFQRLREAGSPGCHLGTLAENESAIAFFERVGFRRLGPPVPIPGMRTRAGARMHEQLMVREVS